MRTTLPPTGPTVARPGGLRVPARQTGRKGQTAAQRIPPGAQGSHPTNPIHRSHTRQSLRHCHHRFQRINQRSDKLEASAMAGSSGGPAARSRGCARRSGPRSSPAWAPAPIRAGVPKPSKEWRPAHGYWASRGIGPISMCFFATAAPACRPLRRGPSGPWAGRPARPSGPSAPRLQQRYQTTLPDGSPLVARAVLPEALGGGAAFPVPALCGVVGCPSPGSSRRPPPNASRARQYDFAFRKCKLPPSTALGAAYGPRLPPSGRLDVYRR